ncbi:hypothetical protein EX30DRAFT_393302 [Ascodesmis nigricans]|uniref:Uncharacterized protein n=1 Tax=Ascodesmis nigricans TaxID=341454 RepID=A0A4S2N3V2_9PEZI|nr:hypothetical protein EX30DRAFT_393302 [Ascodesmis nigricans]
MSQLFPPMTTRHYRSQPNLTVTTPCRKTTSLLTSSPTLCTPSRPVPFDISLIPPHFRDTLQQHPTLPLLTASPSTSSVPLFISSYPIIPHPVSPHHISFHSTRQSDVLYNRTHRPGPDPGHRVIRDDHIIARFLDFFPHAEAGWFLYDNTLVVVMDTMYRKGVMEVMYPETFAGFRVVYVDAETVGRIGKPARREDEGKGIQGEGSVVGPGTRVTPAKAVKEERELCATSLGLLVEIQGNRYLTTSPRGTVRWLSAHDAGIRRGLQGSVYDKCRDEEEVKAVALESVDGAKKIGKIAHTYHVLQLRIYEPLAHSHDILLIPYRSPPPPSPGLLTPRPSLLTLRSPRRSPSATFSSLGTSTGSTLNFRHTSTNLRFLPPSIRLPPTTLVQLLSPHASGPITGIIVGEAILKYPSILDENVMITHTVWLVRSLELAEIEEADVGMAWVTIPKSPNKDVFGGDEMGYERDRVVVGFHMGCIAQMVAPRDGGRGTWSGNGVGRKVGCGFALVGMLPMELAAEARIV